MEKLSYLNRSNLELIDQLYQQYLKSPDSTDPQWRLFFEGLEFAQNMSQTSTGSFSHDELQVHELIQNYRDYGHLKAKLDPLGLSKGSDEAFKLSNFKLSEKNLDQDFQVAKSLGLKSSKLKDIIQFMEQTYCDTLTAQIAECRPEVRAWFEAEFEKKKSNFKLSPEHKKQVFQQLARTESLEKFIHTRYVGTKRFSIEGGDALIPMLEHLVTRGTEMKVEELVIGMAHRGRINVLANFMGKGLEVILSEFNGTAFDNYDYDGDVKYHLGYSADKQTPNGNCHISLAFNPSHLEAVDPVVLGMTRAKQRKRKDTKERKKVIPVLIHGDAAFAGQGVVSETFQMSQLPGYTVGGTIHIITNNQVGFTTDPKDARSSRYSSDVSKSIKAPVLLVNGDDVEACIHATDMAIRFRQEFGEDVVIDLICYRRFGHNEGDEPAFTQPVMYDKIKNHPTLMSIYAEQLAKESVADKSFTEGFYQEKIENLQKIFDQVKTTPPQSKTDAFGGLWKGLRRGKEEDFEKSVATAVPLKSLEKVAQVLTEEPTAIQVHPKIKKLIAARKQMWEQNALDWAMGELLAYGSLCVEGTPVRLSGQDCKRGTFTHRQSVFFDAQTGKEHCPLSTLNPDQGEFVVYNSLLSEMAVVGFEYGNSCSDPTYLTVWEAQFGDFANGAQIIIDQFLSSGEEKWMRGSGLVLLLPHGYEGQGPEHSSARLERFLQLCGQANMQVCNITTPANFFHALRRQVRRDFRKPLVVMSPKSLLRHPKVVSPISEFTNSSFQEVLADPFTKDDKKVETLVLCSGKLFYDLDKAREESFKDRTDISILRLEQLYPFPKVQLAPYLAAYPKLEKVIWAQEEPMNMGALTYILPKLQAFMNEMGLKKVSLEAVSRPEKASPATGSPKVHVKEQNAIIEACFK